MTLLRVRGAAFLAVYLALYHLYIGIYGSPTNRVFLPVHLCIALALCFIVQPLRRGSRFGALADTLGAGGALLILGWCLVRVDDWDLMSVGLAPIDQFFCTLLLVLVAEAVRRTTGWALIVLSGAFMAHALWAIHFPGVLHGAGVSWESLLISLVIGDSGVFGIPVLVIAQYVVLFLLFGRLLQIIGAGAFFSRMAFALFGARVGGPAKAAVLSSALFGTMSGSGVSNVLTTGSFTIPMMIRSGYKPPFAAGVEASAAVGGAIMPPVMGAVAFMMAEFMGVGYVEVAIAAAIPALLYFLAIYFTVHFEAKKLSLMGLPPDLLPNAWPLLKREGYLLLPLATIVALILTGYSVVLVVIWSILTTVLISFKSRGTAVSPHRFASALVATGQLTGPLTVTCAIAGVLIGSMGATGVGFQISQAMVALSGQTLAGMLVVTAVLAFLLGTGLTASAVYITMVATVIPILKEAGVPEMSAHMFAFYFGVVSDITPPTALAAVTAAGIARSHPVTTMNQASRIGIAAFIVPFMFVYSPALLMEGSIPEIVGASLTAGLGLALLAIALTGYAWRDLRALERLALAGICVLLIADQWMLDLVGVLLASALLGPQWWADRRRQRATAMEQSWSQEERNEIADWMQKETLPAPQHDLGRFQGWLLMAVVALVMGGMGEMSWHSRQLAGWLIGLGICAVLVLAALDLNRFLSAHRQDDSLE